MTEITRPHISVNFPTASIASAGRSLKQRSLQNLVQDIHRFISETLCVLHTGGSGSGLWDYTQNRESKLMIHIAGRPILYFTLAPYLRAGIRDFVFTVREHAEQIEMFGEELYLEERLNLKFVEEKEPMGRLGSMKKGVELGQIPANRRILSINGSDIAFLDVEALFKFHQEGLERDFKVTNVIADSYMFEFGEVKHESGTGRVTQRVEKDWKKCERGVGINAGIFLYEPEALQELIKHADRLPVNIEAMMRYLDEKGWTRVYPISGKEFFPVKRREHLKRLEESSSLLARFVQKAPTVKA